MTQSNNASLRESAFRLFSGTGVLGMGGWQTDMVLKVLNGGLEDSESVDVSTFAIPSSCCCSIFVNCPSMSGPPLSSTCISDLSFVFRSTPVGSIGVSPCPDAGHSTSSPPITPPSVCILFEPTREAQIRFVSTASPTLAEFPQSTHLAQH